MVAPYQSAGGLSLSCRLLTTRQCGKEEEKGETGALPSYKLPAVVPRSLAGLAREWRDLAKTMAAPLPYQCAHNC